MRLYLKLFLIVIAIFLTGFILFYFWGSSPAFPEKDYVRITAYSKGNSKVEKDTLSILTYNIGYMSGMTNNEAVSPGREMYLAHLIRAEALFGDLNPTFAGFQEIDFGSHRSYYINQFDSLATKCGYAFGSSAVNWDKKYVPFPYWPPGVQFGRILSGQGVLSKYPILSNRRVVLPKPQGNAFYYNAFYIDRLIQIVEIDYGSDGLMILNVHLEAFDEETRELQSGILVRLVEKYSSDLPLILIGDFNSRPPYRGVKDNMGSTISGILKSGSMHPAVLPDIYTAHPNNYYTFSSRQPYEKIDYIFYNDRIVPLEAGVVRQAGEISDHLPLLFKFIVKK